MDKNLGKIAGWSFIIGALLINIPYSLLITNFNYPDILRESPEKILLQFYNGGDALIYQWLAFAWVGFPILVGIILLNKIFKDEKILTGQFAAAFGITAIIFQLIGLLRWVFVVPVLANKFVEPGTSQAMKDSIIVSFQIIHQYGGVLIGEHLGQIFTIIWTLLISIAMFKSTIFKKWLGWLGIIVSLIYLLAQGELFQTVIPKIIVFPAAGFIGSILWLVWMIILGIFLIRSNKLMT